jgi:hypothetical protein
LHPEGMSSSVITMNSPTSECTTSITSDPATLRLCAIALKSCKTGGNQPIGAKMKLATDTTMATAPAHVVASTCATSARTLPTWNRIARNSGRNETRKYLRNFSWNNRDIGVSPCVLATETEAPLPRPPASEFANLEAMKTIRQNPHLFPIVCRINVDRFQSLLINHPNQAFVNSICVGLREGFWPWADTRLGIYPLTHDQSSRLLNLDKERDFIREQRDDEIAKGRFSKSFGTELLPGMYSMPIHAVL